jgi:hypothetical protein
MDIQLQKTQGLRKIMSSEEFRCADHFGSNNFRIYSINDGTMVKVLENVQQLRIAAELFSILTWHLHLLSKFENCFYQNDQRDELYKVSQKKSFSENQVFSVDDYL